LLAFLEEAAIKLPLGAEAIRVAAIPEASTGVTPSRAQPWKSSNLPP